MTDQAISPLRRRMIEDMAIRKLAAKTQRVYVQRVKEFAAFLYETVSSCSYRAPLRRSVMPYVERLTTCDVGEPLWIVMVGLA